MGRPGLYVVMYCAADERQQVEGNVTVRLGFLVQVSAEAAQLAALTYALQVWPSAEGYTGHGAYAEPAPVEWLKEVLTLVEQVEPFEPFELPREAPASVSGAAEEWPDKL